MGRARDFRRQDQRRKDKRKPSWGKVREDFDAREREPVFVKPEPIRPLTARQGELMDLLETAELIFTLGPAGTGKTYLSAASASDALLEGDADKLILCRPTVGADETNGFLPGDIGKKLAPWVVPFTEVIEQRVGRSRYESFLRLGKIEIVPFEFMRGRTFKNAFVILDEAQNTTYAQMKMFLTRLGENSTTIVNGDVAQTDLKAESGLATALRIIKNQALQIPVVEFTTADVVRSGICRVWTEAFIRHEEAL